jgi:hypothetical protein
LKINLGRGDRGQEAEALLVRLKPWVVAGGEQSFELYDLDAVVAVMKTTTGSPLDKRDQR